MALMAPAEFATDQSPFAITTTEFKNLVKADDLFAGRSQSPASIRTLDGSSCAARTSDGVVSTGNPGQAKTSAEVAGFGADERCVDLGVGNVSSPHWELVYLPLPSHGVGRPAPAELTLLRSLFHERVGAVQFPADVHSGAHGCWAARDVYYIHEVPLVGFGSVMEYGMMFLARALSLQKQLVLGPASSIAWTSDSFCGSNLRSLSCYFNLSSCSRVLLLRDTSSAATGRPTSLSPAMAPRRRNPLNIGLDGFNAYGSAWVSAQLAHFFFSRMTERASTEVRARRLSIGFPIRGAGFGSELLIGMHIRGGDSCAAHRFCPTNKTIYFAQAARLRSAYGANRIVLATDNAEAAGFCRAGVLGFSCRTLQIDRSKFESDTFIEHRVREHTHGQLSGSAVALDALADIDMLADCDMHVLVLRSAVSRLAYALAIARTGQPPPLISLQWPWGPSFHKMRHKGSKVMAGRGARARLGRGGGRGEPRAADLFARHERERK